MRSCCTVMKAQDETADFVNVLWKPSIMFGSHQPAWGPELCSMFNMVTILEINGHVFSND